MDEGFPIAYQVLERDVPVYAAGKADGVWDIADVARLPPDLAETIRRLAD